MRGDSHGSVRVVGHAAVQATWDELGRLRDAPSGRLAAKIPPRFLRYADEQSVVGLAAVLRAVDDHLDDPALDDWGVLAAPRFPGRAVGAAAFARFLRGGGPSISPHIIPQQSLHSVASAISVALGMHGPTFGIGGGPEGLAEGLATAAALADSAPGLWLVATGWDPEVIPDGRGAILDKTAVCTGVALALVAQSRADAQRPRSAPPVVHLAQLARRILHGTIEPGAALACPLPWGGAVELVFNHRRLAKAA